MNNNIENPNNENPTPYRASSNLNTSISNPTMNINNTMDVNIQSTEIANNNIQTENNQIINPNQSQSINIEQNISESINVQNATPQNEQIVQQGNQNVTRTYVENKPRAKKKTISLNFGPEFKIALLITVLLLVFTFILPIISKLIKGY